MPLSVNQEFTRGDIGTVHHFTPTRPVFLLYSPDESTYIVVKKEIAGALGAGAGPALGHNLAMMGAVSPAVNARLLSANEVTELNNYVADWRAISQAVSPALPIPDDVSHLETDITTGGGVWYKMERSDQLTSLENALEAKARDEKGGIRKFAIALNSPGGFEQLGEIIAADLYNNNQDRFTWEPGCTGRFGDAAAGSLIQFTAIQNVGNVFVAIQQGTEAPVGLDSYEAQSQFNNISRTIQQLEAASGMQWGGRLLAQANQARLRQHVDNVFQDLVDALGPRDRKLPFLSKKRLKEDGPTRLMAGVASGKTKLINKLAQIPIADAAMANAVQSRLQLMT